MCTIVVLSRVHPRVGLIVAANRDEFYDRPAEPPQVLDPDTGIVGGRDGSAGGTWMGASPNGFFVGLTNQRTWGGADRTLASRGTVALDALRRCSTEGVRALLDSLDPSRYNPFNLIYGDPSHVEVAYVRSDGVERQPLGPGVHVLTNDRMGSPDFPKANRAGALAQPLRDADGGRRWSDVRRLLGDHDLPDASALSPPPAGSLFTTEIVRALQAVCIHTPTYGTRSATGIVADERGLADYRFADGPPCRAPLVSVRNLFDLG